MTLGTYGRGFMLDNPSVNGLYAPAGNPITGIFIITL